MFIFLPVQYLCDFLGYNHLYELSDGMSLAGFRRLYFTVDNMYILLPLTLHAMREQGTNKAGIMS